MVERDGTRASFSTDEADALLCVTRRGFIGGSIASAVVADNLFGAEVADQKDRWLYSRSVDGPDRYVYKLTYFDGAGQAKQDLYFRERTFGVRARIEVRPTGTVDEVNGRVDLRLRISWATMLPEGLAELNKDDRRFFALDFSFYHNFGDNTYAPSIGVEAQGWVFGENPVLLANKDIKQWIDSKHEPILVRKVDLPIKGGRSRTTSLPDRFRKSVFGALVGAGQTELYFLPQLKPVDRFLWRIVTVGEKEGKPHTALTLASQWPEDPTNKDRPPKNQAELELTTVARASELDIWRETPTLSEQAPEQTEKSESDKTKTAKSKPEETKPEKQELGWVEGKFPEQKPAGSIIRGAFREAAIPGPKLVAAEHRFPNEVSTGVSFVVLDQHSLTLPEEKGKKTADRHATVEFARWATIIDATEQHTEIAAARAFLSGDMYIVSARQAKAPNPEFTEGPLPVKFGELCLSTILAVSDPLSPQQGALGLLCRFPLAEGTFTLETSLGVYSAEGPEARMPEPGEKRDRAPVIIRAENFTTITHFEAAIRITDASVALLDNSATSPQLGAPRGHFSRLDFLGGPEVALRLHGVALPGIRHPGRILLGTTNGVPLPVDPEAAASSLPMERALLRVLRYGDLADLRFRFAGLDLVNDGMRSVLRPRGTSVVARIGDPPPELPPANETGGVVKGKETPVAETQEAKDSKGQAEAENDNAEPLPKPLTGAVHDPRPMIIVEFPPQHRAEQAFFQLRKVRPVPPKVPAKVRETRQIALELQDLHRTYAPDGATARMQHRANILHWLIKELMPKEEGKSDDEWKDNWKDEWKNLAALLKPLAVPKDKLELVSDEKLEQEIRDFLVFADMFAGRFPSPASKPSEDIDVPPPNFPAEQKLYAGPEFVDPDTQRYSELVQQAIEGSTYADGNPLLDRVPIDPVSKAELLALEQNLGSQSGAPNTQDQAKKAAAEQADTLRELRSPGYLAFSKEYNAKIATLGFPEGSPSSGKLPGFAGGDQLRGLVIDVNRALTDKADETEKAKGKETFNTWWKGVATALTPLLNALPSPDTGAEAPVRPVQSRLSGPTRLAFRINTEDYNPNFSTGEIPFTVDALTDFSRFELSVVRRAQKLLLSHLDGTRRPAWDSEVDQDFAHMLVHQGFSRGGATLEPVDARRTEDPGLVEPPGGRRWSEARVTVDQRLAEVVELSSDPPTELETAIEMPFRLMLSPSQDALFRTPRGVPAGLFGPPRDADEDIGSGASALWTAELDPESGAETRAIWSPDYRAEVFLAQEPRREGLWKELLNSTKPALPEFVTRYFPKKRSRVNRAPLRGPYAPWAMGRHISSLSLQDAKDEVEAHRFRTSLDAFDRHELVALSSVYGLPVLGRVSLSGTRIGRDQREPPPGFQVSLMGNPTDKEEPYDLSDIYVPRPLDPQGFELALSSLGGFLSVNASFEPPAAIIDYERGTLFDALSIERWRHRIVLGRDISAEVVYKGYLMPFGISASLIKSTERRFERIDGKGGPVAVLRQRMFIRIAKPVKEFGAFRQADDGRRVPFRKVRMLTLQTPDIVDPFDLAGNKDDTGVWAGGLIDLVTRPSLEGIAQSGTPFWPRTARRPGAEVMFEVLLDDKIRVRLPMVFVDNVTVNRAESLKPLTEYYNLHSTPPDQLPEPKEAYARYVARAALVQRPLFSQKLVFAPPENEGDTEFETETLTFAVEGGRDNAQNTNASTYQPIWINRNFTNNAYLNGADQPPFYPAMRRAVVHVKQIERLTGQLNEPVTVGYDTIYALNGFDPLPPAEGTDAQRKNQRDIFLALLKPLQMRFGNEGQRGGAVARPQIDVVALSRSRGPIGSKDAAGAPATALPTPATTVDNPAGLPQLPEIPPAAHNVKDNKLADFFGGNAKLLGIVKISELLKFLALLFDLEPKLREIREFGGGMADDADAFIRDRVLTPVRNALQAFSNRLENLIFNDVSGTQALERVYPEVSRTMADFVVVLNQAISAAPPTSDTDATIELYSSVYSTGRRFAQAVERVTRDPLTPLREAVRGLVEEFVDQVTGIVTDATKELIETYKPEEIRGWAIKLLQDQLLVQNAATTALANVIIRLPLPASDTLANAVQKSVDEAYAETLLMQPDLDPGGKQKSPWSKKSGQPIFDLKKFGDTFFDKLKTKVSGDPALKAWAEAEETSIQASLDKLQGALWKQFDEIVGTGLSSATDALAQVSTFSVDKVVQALEEIGVAFAKGFEELQNLDAISGQVAAKCLELVDVVDEFVKVVFPRSGTDPNVCIGTDVQRDWVKCRDPAAFPPFYRLIGAVARLADALDVLGGSGTGKLKTLIDKVENHGPSDKVQAALAPLKDFIKTSDAELRQGVKDALGRLLSIARDFHTLQQRYNTARQTAATLCNEPAKLVRSLLDALIQLESQRSAAIRELIQLSKLLNSGLSTLLPQEPGIFALTVPSTSVRPALDANPKDWAWSDVADGEFSTEDAAIYFIETAKKDILAAVLRPATLSASFLADATILAALVTVGQAKQAFDQARDDARKKLLEKLANLDQQVFGALFASLSAVLRKQSDPAFQKVIDLTGKVGTAIDKLAAVDAAIVVFADANTGVGAIDAAKTDLFAYLASFENLEKELVEILIQAATNQIDQAANGVERQALDVLFRIFGSANLKLDELLEALQTPLTAVATTAAKAFETVLDKRNAVIANLPKGSASLNAGLTTLLVACPPDPAKIIEDQLAAQTRELQDWTKDIGAQPMDRAKFKAAATGFLHRVRTWKESGVDAASCQVNVADGPNAVIVIFKQVTEAIDTVVRGEFGKLIDIGAVRREVEARLRDMIPTRLTLAYDFDVELKNHYLGIFLPNYPDVEGYDSQFADCRLTLRARTYIDLLKPAPPKVDVSGSLGAFKIKLIGSSFDVLTLQFDGARFGSDTGGKLKTNITDFKLGKMVEFLDSISQWVSFGENGFFLSLRYDLPGIEAGYRMPPIYLTLGALNISNVSLNASCVLPFSDGSAIFKVGLSRPEAPFSITSTIFGGCGHLALYASSTGIIGFSASLEFGAIVDFKLGPVTGRGQITAGVYIRSIDMGNGRVSTIEGVFTAAGSAKIAMFSVMAMLQVRVGQQASGGVAGSAIFVFSFSLGIKDIEFRFVIFKQEQKGFGGGGLSASLESPTRFGALEIDPLTTGATNGMPTLGDTRPKISSVTRCKSEHFADYIQYFSEEQPWILSS